MENLFTKAQLKEMVQDRIKWLQEVGGEILALNETNRKSFILCVNFKHYPNRPNRFTKAEMVEAINLLDGLRAAKIA